MKKVASATAFASAASALPHGLGKSTGVKPNVLLVMTDDQAWEEVGYNGHGVHTPNIDQMTNEGITFTRYYAGVSKCSPTRACIMTGRSNVRSGVMKPNKFIEGQKGIHHKEKCLPLLFKAAGYRTGHFGKWHLDLDLEPSPNKIGYDKAIWNHNHFNDGSKLLVDETGERVELEGDCSEAIVGKALEFIEECKVDDVPFFVTIWFGSPHASYESSAQFRSLYPDSPCRDYLAEITGTDSGVGILRDNLAQLGLEQNTQIWFCTDNGADGQGGCERDVCGSDGCYEPSIYGGKGSVFEGGIRVPGTLVWPGVITEPRVIDAPVGGLDFYPTFKEMLGVEYPEGQPMPLDGEDIMPIVMGTAGDRSKPLPFWNIQSQKLEEVYAGADSESAMIEKRFKIFRWDEKYKLYDLIADPKERDDVSEQYPEKFEEMKQALIEFEESAALSLRGHDYDNTSVSHSSSTGYGTNIDRVTLVGNRIRIKTNRTIGGKAGVEIWNGAGRLVFRRTLGADRAGIRSFEFDIGNLSRGMYYLRLRGERGISTMRPFLY